MSKLYDLRKAQKAFPVAFYLGVASEALYLLFMGVIVLCFILGFYSVAWVFVPLLILPIGCSIASAVIVGCNERIEDSEG